MKSLSFSKLITLILAVLVAGSAFAANDHKGNLQVYDPVQVNGKQLTAGEYTVTWDGDGPSVNINIVRDRKVIATAAAKIVPLEEKAVQDTAELKASPNGAKNLTAISFSGKKYKLELSGDTSQSSERSGDSVK